MNQIQEDLRQAVDPRYIPEELIPDKNRGILTYCPFCENPSLSVCLTEGEGPFKQTELEYQCSSCTFFGTQVKELTCFYDDGKGHCSFYPATHNKLNLIGFFKKKFQQQHFLYSVMYLNREDVQAETINEILTAYNFNMSFESLSAEEKDKRYREYWAKNKGDAPFDYSEHSAFYSELYHKLFKSNKNG